MPLGNLGNALPDGGEAIRQALSRRQSGGSVPLRDQISGGSPGAGGVPIESPVPGSVRQSDTGVAPQQQGGGQSQQPMSPDSREAQTIIQALSTRLKGLTDMQKPQ